MKWVDPETDFSYHDINLIYQMTNRSKKPPDRTLGLMVESGKKRKYFIGIV